ncbi:FecR family protein [Mucilaginibacter sp.]|uniref:FecR family protein n=1 Tax=Mucilaginibacter sp. TaxID=1882438 RepID=UPI003D114E35
MEENYLKELIEKYIKDTATSVEREELLAWYRNKTKDELLLPYTDIGEEEESKQRMLQSLHLQIRSDKPVTGKIKPLYYKVAAAAAILICAFLFLQKNIFKHPADGAAFSTVITRAGEHKTIKLTDGSVIWLSAGSSVSFPSAFNGATREISFEGEAFFEIAKDKKHPFIVHTGKTSTRVLGTSFNINSFKEHQNIVVSLITGKVAFSDNKTQVQLLPGHEVLYNKTSGAAKLQDIPDMQAVINRRNGYYEYKNVRVADVIEDINLNLNTKIMTQGNVKDCQFYGRLKPGESIENFLQKLAIVVNAKVINLNDGYLIKGRGCN